MDLMHRLGGNLPEAQAAVRRAHVLGGLAGQSETGFADKAIRIAPGNPVESYFLFVAITGCLGVPAEQAAIRLEEVVRRQ